MCFIELLYIKYINPLLNCNAFEKYGRLHSREFLLKICNQSALVVTVMKAVAVSLETAVRVSFASQLAGVAAEDDGIIPKKGGYITSVIWK